MYDLRYAKVVSEWNPYRNKTTPIVSYAGHTNSHSLRLGFDVSPDGSLLAAGTASLDLLILAGEDHYVRLWSVNTGQRIHARISENAFDSAIIGIQFSRKLDNGIYIAGQEMEFWSI